MWTAFIWENVHFATNCLAALVFFAMFWLYFDAWVDRKPAREIPKLIGILLLSVSFIVHATQMESGLIINSFMGIGWQESLFLFTRISGYVLLAVGVLLDPLLPAPKNKGLEMAAVVPAFFADGHTLLIVSLPILCVMIAWLYLRRATVGLEKHLKSVTIAFFVLSFSELLSLSDLYVSSSNVALFQLAASTSWLWIVRHGVMMLGILILGKWVWQYLTKRLQPQLYMIFTASVLGIFLLTTSVFTGLLLKNIQTETLSRLETDVKVLNYSLESKKQGVLSDAQVMVQQETLAQKIQDKNQIALSEMTQKFLLGKSLSFLVVTDANGRVLARGEDRDRVGDSVSSDPLVVRALGGQEAVTVFVKNGVLAPEVSIRAVVPVRTKDAVVGVVLAGTVVDNAFVDGVKAATGLEAAVYGGDVLSATTQISSDGKSRWIGTKETDPEVRSSVLQKGQSFAGSHKILNTPFFVSFMPLKDVDGATIGMLFVGKPEIGVLKTAGQSIELTFVVTALLLVLSVIPSYLISYYISDQMR